LAAKGAKLPLASMEGVHAPIGAMDGYDIAVDFLRFFAANLD
jgi:hypothetical protein